MVLGTSAAAGNEPEWRPCPDRPSVQCGELDVPLDRTDPHSRTIALPLRRTLATDPQRRIGTLITIAGGPGQRGTDWVRPEVHLPSISARFDIVSFDPRGTSGETAITCIPAWDPFGDLDRTPDDTAERTTLDDAIRELAAGCQRSHANVLPHIGTAETVLDVEALREVLGEDQVSLLGSSYGSEVALRYASAYPAHTRALVLDGYRDANISPVERELEQAVAFERELSELLVECALRADCPVDDPTPGAVLDRLLAALDDRPIPAEDGRVLRQSDAYEAIAGSLVRGPQERQRMLRAIANAADGNGHELLAMADEVRADYEAGGLNQGAFMAIVCADEGEAWSALSDADVAALTERVLEAAPRLGPWLWSPPAADDLPPLGLCAMTVSDAPSATGPFDGSGTGPILVLAASGDPTTPLSAAVRAVDDLTDASLLSVRMDRHLVYPFAVAAPDSPAGRCIGEAVEAYLIDGSTPDRSACP